MKLIDEKGRLFGKINIIDLLIVITLIYTGSVFYTKGKKLKKLEYNKVASGNVAIGNNVNTFVSTDTSFSPPQCSVVDLYLTIKFGGYNSAITNAVSIGDKKEDDPFVRIKEIISIKPFQILSASGIIDHPELKNIVVRMAVRASKINDKFYYDKMALKIGSQFLFKSDRYDMNGEILEIKVCDDCAK